MKKKAVLVLLAGMVTSFGLIGCSLEDGTVDTETVEVDVESEPGISQIDVLYAKMMNGEASAEELRELANLYKEAGLIARQRDVLEQCYMTYGDGQDLLTLSEIWVNADEDNAQVKDEISLLIASLSNEELRGEAISQIEDRDFLDLLKPGIYEGCRNYFLTLDDKTASLCVGYEDNGLPYVKVWVEYADGRMVSLNKENVIVKLFDGHTSAGQYDGLFTQWVMNEKTGDITVETGSIKNGNLDGDYTASVHKGEGAKSASDIYAGKADYSYNEYKGSFDGSGATTTDKPNELTIKALTEGTDYSSVSVYAYNDKKNSFLYKGIESGNAYTYSIANWGIVEQPTYEKYDVVASENTGSNVEVKVVNGRLFVFDGKTWVDMGNIQDVAKEDPFVAARENRPEVDISEVEVDKNDAIEVGGVVEEKKQTESKPSTKPTPAPAADPAPAPAPAPSSGGGGGGNSNPDPAPAPAPAPAPEPEPAPAPAEDPAPSGGDTDVEWTDDLL